MTTEGFNILVNSSTREGLWGVSVETAGFEPVDEIAAHLRSLMAGVYESATDGERPRTATHDELASGRWHQTRLRNYCDADGTTNVARFRRHLACWRTGLAPQPCRIRLGAVVRGDECFGRESFLEEVVAALPSRNVVLLAPRRFGKTSILFHLLDAPPNGFRPVLVDLESANTPAEFLAVVAVRCLRDEELWSRLTDVEPIRTAQGQAQAAAEPAERERQLQSLLTAAFAANWQGPGSDLLDALGGTPRLLLLVDEFSELLRALRDDPPALKQFLDWFRAERQGQPEDGFRLALASSTGARHLLDSLGYPDALDDLLPLTVPPLSREAAGILLEELLYAAGAAPSPAVVGRALDLLGQPVPYFVQVMAQELALAAERGEPLTLEAAENVYDDRVLGVEGKAYFRDFSLRLRGYPPSIERGAQAVLEALSHAERVPADMLRERFLATGGLKAADFETVMAYLEEDYYIERTDGDYGFRSKLLRDFWRRHGEVG
jgi:hypothetical protein